MVTDLLLSWPRNCDYPLWRQFLRDNRTKFNEVVIAFTETHQGEDYREFVKSAMFDDYVLFLDAPQPNATVGEDWRDVAINSMLLHSYNAPWLWFTEQDFYPADGFWQEVESLEQEGCDVIAAYQGTRMHPCCIFIKREALQKTRKDFGIIKDKADHFSKVQEDVESNGLKIGIIDPNKYQHLNGLSHNLTLLGLQQAPNYQIDAFFAWLEACLAVSVPIDDKFRVLTAPIITAKMREKGVNHSPTPPKKHSPRHEKGDTPPIGEGRG